MKQYITNDNDLTSIANAIRQKAGISDSGGGAQLTYPDEFVTSIQQLSTSVQSDWLQNDSTKEDYVKNRPGGYDISNPLNFKGKFSEWLQEDDGYEFWGQLLPKNTISVTVGNVTQEYSCNILQQEGESFIAYYGNITIDKIEDPPDDAAIFIVTYDGEEKQGVISGTAFKTYVGVQFEVKGNTQNVPIDDKYIDKSDSLIVNATPESFDKQKYISTYIDQTFETILSKLQSGRTVKVRLLNDGYEIILETSVISDQIIVFSTQYKEHTSDTKQYTLFIANSKESEGSLFIDTIDTNYLTVSGEIDIVTNTFTQTSNYTVDNLRSHLVDDTGNFRCKVTIKNTAIEVKLPITSISGGDYYNFTFTAPYDIGKEVVVRAKQTSDGDVWTGGIYPIGSSSSNIVKGTYDVSTKKFTQTTSYTVDKLDEIYNPTEQLYLSLSIQEKSNVTTNNFLLPLCNHEVYTYDDGNSNYTVYTYYWRSLESSDSMIHVAAQKYEQQDKTSGEVTTWERWNCSISRINDGLYKQVGTNTTQISQLNNMVNNMSSKIVHADWNETNSQSYAYVYNKPGAYNKYTETNILKTADKPNAGQYAFTCDTNLVVDKVGDVPFTEDLKCRLSPFSSDITFRELVEGSGVWEAGPFNYQYEVYDEETQTSMTEYVDASIHISTVDNGSGKCEGYIELSSTLDTYCEFDSIRTTYVKLPSKYIDYSGITDYAQNSILINSSTEGSNKQFILTVDDSGNLKITEKS